jgi:Mg2+ and Co2+ transporter CorA
METMTSKMQTLTGEMHELAQKTTQETVSMRIITLVTLFFLPGTFISVGYYLILRPKERNFWDSSDKILIRD